ncbi:hypothetical protein LSAT2_009386, partial [Lamellibrachia satsuma]
SSSSSSSSRLPTPSSSPPPPSVYITVVAVLIFIVPALIIAACYVVIVKIVWSKDHDVKNLGVTHDKKNVSMTRISDVDTRTMSTSRGSCRAFLCCWTPYFVFDLLQVFGVVVLDTDALITINVFIQSFSSMHSAVNPVTFFIFNTRLCTQLSCRFCSWVRRLPCPYRLCRTTAESQATCPTDRGLYSPTRRQCPVTIGQDTLVNNVNGNVCLALTGIHRKGAVSNRAH